MIPRTAGVGGKISCALYRLPSTATAGLSCAFETRHRLQAVLLLPSGAAVNPTSTCPGGITNGPCLCFPNHDGSRYDAAQRTTIGFEQFR
jgi:hypothetical protein